MAGGRPTDYLPEYCERVEAFMADGYSKLAAAGSIGVTYQTVKNWMEVHPEFFAAVKRGEAKRAVKLEQGLLEAENSAKVTSRIFALKNAAPEEWADKVHSELTGKDGGPIKTEDVTASEILAARLDAIASRTAG